MTAPVFTTSGDNLDIYPYNPPYAGFWRRAAACTIDGIIVGIATIIPKFIVGLMLGYLLVSLNPEIANHTRSLGNSVGSVLGVVFTMAYYAYFDTQKNGVTFGRQALGLALITQSGEPITRKQSVRRTGIRFLSAVLLNLGLLFRFLPKNARPPTICLSIRWWYEPEPSQPGYPGR